MSLSIICLFVMMATLVGVQGQFPRACINARDMEKRHCCPVPSGYKEPCGSDKGRGECKPMEHSGEWNEIYDHYDKQNTKDDRHNWPRLFFDHSCHCKSSFSGPDCSQCEFGYHGDNCEKRKTLKRRNFMELSDEDKDQYMWYVNLSRHASSDYVVATTFYADIEKAIAKEEDPSSKFVNVTVYDLYVWHHYYATRNTYLVNDSTIKEDIDFAHKGQGFPTWHRYYLLSWERAIQEITGDYDFTIPYWDWTENKLDELCTEELLGVNGPDKIVKGKYFDGWYSICTKNMINKSEIEGTRICNPEVHRVCNLRRAPGANNDSLPEKEEVNFLLRFENHDFPPYSKHSSCSFRNMLEGFVDTKTAFYSPKAHTLHNQVHLYIGGEMGDVPSAPNDPIFFLHHSYIDRIFEKWLRRYKKDVSVLSETEAPIGHNRNSPIVPLFPIKTHEQMFKQSWEFGYDYEDVNENGESKNDGDQDPKSGLGKCLDICPQDVKSEGSLVHPSALLLMAFIGTLFTF